MDFVHFEQNGDCSTSTHTENSLPPDSDNSRETKDPPQIPSDSHDSFDNIFGEPEVSPRVGDEYQAILPTLIESHSVKTMKMEALEELHSFPTEEETRICNGPCDILISQLANTTWNVLEKDSFLLGLYIFEKNFTLVRRLVGTKTIGDVLSFYYGHFYSSREYRRWSECRKAKGKKGIGQRIFSGARQQELLNRILVGVSDESRNDILEVTKMFGEDKMSLSDYVFSLDLMVGIGTLVDAFAIGKGKLDLTEMPSESSRSNLPRPEIPTGKALSSLTTDEIVKILSGNYRLSKARANDIFWEAIWPRLLARGWHSEQPNNLVRLCLVFLVPGVKKFSRRKLVKGEHYFDSLTDILIKVAKEPELINLDFQDEMQCEISVSEKKLEKEKEKHCYLQPRTLNRNMDVVKFTVVDTSLSGGKVRELRSFPSEITDDFKVKDFDSDIDGEIPITSNCGDVGNLNGKTARKSEKKTKTTLKKDINRAKKGPKAQKLEKRGQEDHSGPLAKRCRILITSHDQETKKVHLPDIEEVSMVHDITSEVGAVENAPHPPLLIDLNLPGIPSENEEMGRENNRAANELTNEGMEQTDNLNTRRLSTRYRPPTMRAMQAVASGYLAVSQRRKGKAKFMGENERDNSVNRNDSGDTNTVVESGVLPEAILGNGDLPLI